MEMRTQIRGIAELEKTFRNIPKGTRRRAIMPSLRAGGAVIRGLAESNLKAAATEGYSTGYAAKQVRVYTLRKYRGSYRVAVQIRRKAVNTRKIVNGEPVRVGLYVAVLEYGKSGQPPKSWIRKAIREGKNKATEAVARQFRINLPKAIAEAKR
jgi:HK97 gp10 family phage protein